MIVLDASALVAFARHEPGADRVVIAPDLTTISAVNFGEACRVLLRSGFDWPKTKASWTAQGLRVEPLSLDDAERAAQIAAPLPRRYAISLADCICVALAERLNARVLKTDRQWRDLDVAVPIEIIR
ncbi:MAG: PIN domain-containing protein [Maricaulaceae bacterium]